jgi:hypothetical protein
LGKNEKVITTEAHNEVLTIWIEMLIKITRILTPKIKKEVGTDEGRERWDYWAYLRWKEVLMFVL